MTLTELRYIVAIAQDRHFGRAAARCSITQPALSLAVQKLEDELGVKIFDWKKSSSLASLRHKARISSSARCVSA
jgi:LysR family transcriptional regulator, hydrogen peroxide-inducible genes activator